MKERTFPALLDSIPEVTMFIDAELEALDCPMKTQMQIDMAVDEMFGNIARYAYGPETGEAAVRFEYDEKERAVTITFTDRGIPFDPVRKADPDVSLPAEARGIGGLGIFLVKKTMDGMVYRREDGCNILSIAKKL